MPLKTVNFPRWENDSLGTPNRPQLRADLEEWIRSEPLVALAEAWGAEAPIGLGPLELYEWFDTFSAQHWDFRKGGERNLAAHGQLTPEQIRASIEAAEALGIMTPRPPQRSSYDYVLILGGLVRACITRPRFAAQLTSEGIRLGSVFALGGFRPLGGDEIDLAKSLGIQAENEFEAMVEGVKSAFEISEPPILEASSTARSNGDWATAYFQSKDITVIAAPSLAPSERRANTSDTFAWWAERTPNLRGKTILLVTAAIYVPYQGAAAIEKLGLPFDASIETVGISDEAGHLGEHTQTFSEFNYLQEIRSAIRGHASLYLAITADTRQ
jgi:hypothetical protein